jgi:hypothetical protein
MVILKWYKFLTFRHIKIIVFTRFELTLAVPDVRSARAFKWRYSSLRILSSYRLAWVFYSVWTTLLASMKPRGSPLPITPPDTGLTVRSSGPCHHVCEMRSNIYSTRINHIGQHGIVCTDPRIATVVSSHVWWSFPFSRHTVLRS